MPCDAHAEVRGGLTVMVLRSNVKRRWHSGARSRGAGAALPPLLGGGAGALWAGGCGRGLWSRRGSS